MVVLKPDSTGPRPHEVTLRRWRLMGMVTPITEPWTKIVWPKPVEAATWFEAREMFARALPGVNPMSLRGEELTRTEVDR